MCIKARQNIVHTLLNCTNSGGFLQITERFVTIKMFKSHNFEIDTHDPHFISAHTTHEIEARDKVSDEDDAFRINWALCEGNAPVSGGFPSQRVSNAELWYFFDVSPKKLLNKHSGGRWLEGHDNSCEIFVMKSSSPRFEMSARWAYGKSVKDLH